MPTLKNDQLPKYRKHKASGQAIVTIGGRDNYLGPHGTVVSKLEYDRTNHPMDRQWPSDKSPPSRRNHSNAIADSLLGFCENVLRQKRCPYEHLRQLQTCNPFIAERVWGPSSWSIRSTGTCSTTADDD